MNELRCERCKHLLAKEQVLYGELEIKCPYCNWYNTIEILSNTETGASK